MSDISEEDRALALFMHAQTCDTCSMAPFNSTACETGRTMAIGWLTHRAKQGDPQAQQLLDYLMEGNWSNRMLIPPGIEIRRV